MYRQFKFNEFVQMKNMGGQRISPAEQASQRSDSQNVWDKHLQDKPRNVFNCPLCNNTFSELNVLKTVYIHTTRKVITRGKKQKKTFAFFHQERGCKKKYECDFLHDQVNKVPKVGWNGPRCRCVGVDKFTLKTGSLPEVILPREERLRFGRVDRSQPPPGSWSSGSRSQSQRTQRVPDSRNLVEFSGMKKPRHMT